MSKTPKTDQFYRVNPGDQPGYECKFAQGLERELDKARKVATALNAALHAAVGENGDGWEAGDGEDLGPTINAAFAQFDTLNLQTENQPTKET